MCTDRKLDDPPKKLISATEVARFDAHADLPREPVKAGAVVATYFDLLSVEGRNPGIDPTSVPLTEKVRA